MREGGFAGEGVGLGSGALQLTIRGKAKVITAESGCATRFPRLLQKRYGLNAGDFKAFAAAHVLAHDHVIAADHIGLGFGELGAVALVGAAGKLALFGAHQPGEFVVTGLAAMRAGEGVGFPGFLFVEKIALVHFILLSTTEGTENTGKLVNWVIR